VKASPLATGWLAGGHTRARVLSCLYARLSHHASRVAVGKTVNYLEERRLEHRLIRGTNDVLLEFRGRFLTAKSLTCVSIDDSINCPLRNSTVRRRTSPGKEANPGRKRWKNRYFCCAVTGGDHKRLSARSTIRSCSTLPSFHSQFVSLSNHLAQPSAAGV
jgi:hypothetical protein